MKPEQNKEDEPRIYYSEQAFEQGEPFKPVYLCQVPRGITVLPAMNTLMQELCEYLGAAYSDTVAFRFDATRGLEARLNRFDSPYKMVYAQHLSELMRAFLRERCATSPPESREPTVETLPAHFLESELQCHRGKYLQVMTGGRQQWIRVPKSRTGLYRESFLGIPLQRNRRKNTLIRADLKGDAFMDAKLSYTGQYLHELWEWIFAHQEEVLRGQSET